MCEKETTFSYTLIEELSKKDYKALKRFCNEYTFSIHISYKFHFNEYGKNSIIDLNACHPIIKEYDNPNSIYCYSNADFKDLLNNIYDKYVGIYDAISKSRLEKFDKLVDRRFENFTLEQLTPQ